MPPRYHEINTQGVFGAAQRQRAREGNMSIANKMIDAHGGRKEMLKIIDTLRHEGERRCSTSPFARADAPRID